MVKRSRERPGLIVKRTPRGLSPVSSYDAEVLAGFPLDMEFDVVPRSKRSLPQLRTYWKALTLVVHATDAWPTPEHLHEALKIDLGYVSKVTLLSGETRIVADSAGINAMSQEDFKVFFDKAMARLAETTGIDPLSFLSEAA